MGWISFTQSCRNQALFERLWQGLIRDRVWLQQRVRLGVQSHSRPDVRLNSESLSWEKGVQSAPPTRLEIDPTFNHSLAPALAPNSRLRRTHRLSPTALPPRLHPRLRLLHHPFDTHYCTTAQQYQQYHRPPASLCFVLIGHSRLLPRATPLPDKAKTSASFLSIYLESPQAQIAPPVCVASSTVRRCDT